MNIINPDKHLFLFAHPDDDVFIAGTMRLLLEWGADLLCLWLTSGNYFGKGELRETELADAAKILGLHKSRIRLLKLPDLGLVSMLDRAGDLVAQVMAEFRPNKIFATAFEGGHPDHDAGNFLAYEARSRAGIAAEIFEFPLYNSTGSAVKWKWRINEFPPGGLPVFHRPLTHEAVVCKYRMMRTYKSQWMYMIPARLASSRSRLVKIGEPYRLCPPDRDHSLPPHQGVLNYERWFNFFIKLTFHEFRTAVLQARRKQL